MECMMELDKILRLVCGGCPLSFDVDLYNHMSYNGAGCNISVKLTNSSEFVVEINDHQYKKKDFYIDEIGNFAVCDGKYVVEIKDKRDVNLGYYASFYEVLDKDSFSLKRYGYRPGLAS